MNKASLSDDVRQRFVAYLRDELVGPADGDDEVLWEPPNRRYLMGTLFPANASADSNTPEPEVLVDEVNGAEVGEGGHSSTSPTTTEELSDDKATGPGFLPNSLGVSTYTTATALEVTIRAAKYTTFRGSPGDHATENGPTAAPGSSPTPAVDSSDVAPTNNEGSTAAKGRIRGWARRSVNQEPIVITGSGTTDVLEGSAVIDVRWRDLDLGSLVTVTLRNSTVAKGTERPQNMWGDQLFQCSFELRAADGVFLEYPSAASVVADPEADELSLRYRSHKTHAVGHGCAVAWSNDPVDVTALETVVMPTHLVPAIAPAGDVPELALDQRALAAGAERREEVCSALAGLVEEYQEWVSTTSKNVAGLEGRDAAAAKRILHRMDVAADRMRRGVRTLAEDNDAYRAFTLANQAMVLQAAHAVAEIAGSRRALTEPSDLDAVDPYPRIWRPFQMGYFLTVVAGLVDDHDPDRGTVDLLWFPTGGGKTEAYLLLAAFEMFHRRLRHGADGAGTAVLSRYTLSLLTTQQFQRAAGLVMACEWIRRQENGDVLGDRPFSIGLWVGDATTPNKFEDAARMFAELRGAGETEDVFLLERCPWCGTEIVPRRHVADDNSYGIFADKWSFRFRCPRVDCDFHGGLPVHVVDQDLYQEVPTFVLGTVDKFADLAWEGRGGCFFGDRGRYRPPSLIIQDELHLLTGPLGTTVGLYEHAIDMLCEREGIPPKIIASTATIRRAGEQVLGLYGRTTAIFPPPGTDESDSFFARADDSLPGRLYLGIMAQGHTSDTATVHTAAALLQAPVALDLDGADRDLLWTLVVYHASLRELGRTVTMSGDDIPARLEARFGSAARRVDVEELTSNVPRSLQPELLERLGKTYDQPERIDLLASTNMISVGVDVPRLGLMLVNGQPKATAEYIQATSRVGRRDPGLVVGLFRSTRPRDRSHYEAFRPYHSALYKHVEPSSVTPYAPPSRDRALHASLVILARHRLGLAQSADADRIIESAAEVRVLVERLVAVAQAVDRREADDTRKELNVFLDEWLSAATAARAAGKPLHFSSRTDDESRLLRDFWKGSRGRPTMRSMRNVDRQSTVYVIGTPKRKRR